MKMVSSFNRVPHLAELTIKQALLHLALRMFKVKSRS